jgi:hypothetical protein
MGLGSGIRDPGPGIRKKPIPDPGSGSRVKKAPDPGSGSATLLFIGKLKTSLMYHRERI